MAVPIGARARRGAPARLLATAFALRPCGVRRARELELRGVDFFVAADFFFPVDLMFAS